MRTMNVRIGGIKPEMVFAIFVIEGVFFEHGEQFILTSVVDGVHGKVSYHKAGFAIDFKLPTNDKDIILGKCQARIGPEFDIVFESDHGHAEFDVRRQGELQ